MAVCHKDDIHIKRQVFLEYIRLSISGITVLLALCKTSHGDDFAQFLSPMFKKVEFKL